VHLFRLACRHPNGGLTKLVSDLDTANLLIRKHGAKADREAARLQDLMLDRGDDEGRQVWTRIRGAIEALQVAPRNKPH
jgi:hypothetical protein